MEDLNYTLVLHYTGSSQNDSLRILQDINSNNDTMPLLDEDNACNRILAMMDAAYNAESNKSLNIIKVRMYKMF